MSNRKINITQKLATTYIVIIISTIISGVFSLFTLFKYQEIDQEMVLVNNPCIDEIETVQEISINLNTLTKNWVFLSNLKDKEKIEEIIKKDYSNSQKNISKILKRSKNKRDRKNFYEINKNSKTFLRGVNEINLILVDFESFFDEDKVNKATEIYTEKIENILKKNNRLFSQVLKEKKHRQEVIFKEKQTLFNYLTLIVFLAVIAILLLSIYSIYYTKKKIALPLIELKKIISNVTIGDILKINRSSETDEIAEMQNELSSLVDSLIEKTAFAKEIGQGNYFSEINILSEKDKLGYSLLDMSFELQKNNLQIKNSQESLKNAQITAKIGSWEYEIDSKKLSWSDEMYNLFEMEPQNSLEELISIYKTKIHPEDKPTLSQLINKMLISGKDFEYKHRIIKANGEIKYIYGKGIIEKNKFDKIVRIKGIAQDISQQKKTEKEIINLINFQNSILNSTEQSIISTNIDGTITHFNLGAEKLLGYSSDEILNIHNPGLFHLEEEVVSRAEKLSKELNIKIEPGFDVFITNANIKESDTNEWTYIHKNGTHIPVELTVTARRDSTNNIIGYTGVASDISVKNAQISEIKTLKNALDETSLVAIINTKGIFETVNDKFCLFSGYSRDELIGQNRKLLDSDFHTNEFWIEMIQTISKGEIWKNEVQNKNKKNDFYWVDETIVPVLDENGKPKQYISILQDITERKHFEEVIINQRRTAENLTKAKDDFMSSMSHEIRTPLNGIIGFTNILINNTNLTEQQNKQLEAIKTSGDILLVIINDILDIAKIESGKMNLEENPIQLKELSQLIIDTFAVKINEKELIVKIECDENLNNNLLGDSVRISQILFNLVSNAIKFTPLKGSIIISIKTIKEDNEKNTVEISVKDSGIGIPSDKINTVFEAFVQTSDDTARKYGGTGLGLSIVQKLLVLMEGTISVESEFGIGTTFTAIIPFKKNTKQDMRNSLKYLKSLKDNENNEEEIKVLKILLAEDNFINQLLAQTVLMQFNYEVTTVENGVLAIEAIKSNTFDIVLMDLMMPEMDGYEASIGIRALEDEEKSNIPIIAVSADVTNSVKTKCKNVGINDYISKPFDSKELKYKILNLIKR